MRPLCAYASAFAVLLVMSVGGSAHAQNAARTSGDALGLGDESPALARLRDTESDASPLPRTVAEAAAQAGTELPEGLDRELASRLQMPALRVRLTPRIANYLARYRTDRSTRRALAGWLRHAGRYRVRIEALLASEGMPTELVWVAAAESGFDPSDTSWVGAVGLWQLMTDTARSYGLRVDAWVDERRDPERSTRAAAHLLRDLYNRFGAWDLALAAYNMGYGALLRTIRKYNTNDFERVASLEAGLPFETTTYVPRILAAAIGARNVDALGFNDVTPDAAITWEDVTVMRSVPLDGLAHALGIGVDVLRAINPALVGSRTPPGDDVHPFVLHVPLGLHARASAWIDGVHLAETRTYVVRHGETLDEIATRYGLANASALLALSGFPSTTHIEPGTSILVPLHDASSAAPSDRPLVAIETVASAPAGRRRVFYHVVQGESVRDIAAALGVARDDLVAWNALDANARLQGGLWLQAFVSGAPSDARAWEESEVTLVQRGSEEFYDRLAASGGRERHRVTVRDGDTMRSIAEHYGLSVGTLARINHRSRHAALTAGEEIVVYAQPENAAQSSSAPEDNAHGDVPAPSCPVPSAASDDDASESGSSGAPSSGAPSLPSS